MKELQYILLGSALAFIVSCTRVQKISPVKKDIHVAVFGNGFIEQDKEYVAAAMSAGVITRLPVSEGDTIAQNELIAAIKKDVQHNQVKDARLVYEDAKKNTDPGAAEIQQLQAQIVQAESQRNTDKINYDRYLQLKKTNSVSYQEADRVELQYKASVQNLAILEERMNQLRDQLQLAADRSRMQLNTQQVVLQDYQVLADNRGQIIEVYKRTGEWVKMGDPVAKIGAGGYKIRLYISEEDITKVLPGQKVAVHLNTYNSTIFPATVSKIFPGFNSQEQSYVIEALFDTLPPRLFSGTQLQANIETGIRKGVLVIPTTYLMKGSFVTLEGGKLVAVQTGMQSGDWIEITAGVSEKDVLIKKEKKQK